MKLKILFSHNRYQLKGGEDSVVTDEIKLLQKNGHEVFLYDRDNIEINDLSKLRVLKETIWSSKTTQDIQKIIHDFKPDIIHSHNTFPLISPSLYWVASKKNIPIVQTLHNFRLFCLQAMFLRNNNICEDCIGRIPWRGVLRKCYRDSTVQSTVLATLLTTHRYSGTYNNKVTRYIALNDFCKGVFVRGGLPKSRILLKPNFVDLNDPQGSHDGPPLYVGRLSQEKGIETLVDAIKNLQNFAIDVVGTGPLENSIKNKQGLNLYGWQDTDKVYKLMSNAAYLVMPSIWYENFPRTLVEAFANGLPVIASRLGAMAELIEDHHTGLLFDPGSAADLSRVLLWAEDNREKMQEMGCNARQVYENKYTSEINYNQLISIYNDAISTTQS